MEEKYKKVIKNYFSDYVIWLMIVSLLFIAALTASIVFNGSNRLIWVIPLLFGIIYLFSLPLLVLYIKVRIDCKNHSVEKAVFKIFDLQTDSKFNFKNGGGVIIGKTKYRILDEENNAYLICASSEKKIFTGFHPAPDFFVEIESLKTSKLVLSMRIHENKRPSKESRKQESNINLLKQSFKNYFLT